MCLLEQDDKKLEDDSVNKRQRKGNHYLTEVSSADLYVKYSVIKNLLMVCSLPATWLQLSCHSSLPTGEDGELRENKVRSMATQLLAKFEENSSTVWKRSKVRRSKPGKLFYLGSFNPRPANRSAGGISSSDLERKKSNV